MNAALDPVVKFKTSVYFYSLDVIISTIDSRFQSNRGILTDLSFFSYSHLKDVAKSGSLPPNTFLDVSKWLPEINVDS